MQGESVIDIFKCEENRDYNRWNKKIWAILRSKSGRVLQLSEKETCRRCTHRDGIRFEPHPGSAGKGPYSFLRLRAEGAGGAAPGIAIGRNRTVDGAFPLLLVLRSVEGTIGTGRHGRWFSLMPLVACLAQGEREEPVCEDRPCNAHERNGHLVRDPQGAFPEPGPGPRPVPPEIDGQAEDSRPGERV